MTARSNNIGQSWNLAGAVSPDDTMPRGQTDVAVTRDGSQWITWVDAEGGLALRRVDRDKGMHLVQHLPLDFPATMGPYARPRMTLLDNRSDQPARLMIVRPEPGGIRSYVATLPLEEGAAVDACGCGPGESEAKGHPIKGTIMEVRAATNTLVVAHEGIPDVMPAQTFTFHVEPAVIPLVTVGKRVMARTERRDDGKWWLASIRLLQSVD
jgi:Cu/Ag efflux protein CusF